MKKEVKIFLASSITELQNERNELEVFIRNMSDMYEEQYGIKIRPVRCEQIDPYITERTQDIINRSLIESEMCVVLVYTRFGEFTKEEFNVALDMFKNSSEHLPKIYVYFKQLDDNIQPDESVKSFMTELNDSLQHYYGIFKSIDTVKLRIALNFVAQKQNMAKVAISEGKVFIDGAELSNVNLSEVSEFSNNQELIMLNEELRSIEPRYYELLAEYKKGNESVYEEYTKLAIKRTNLKKEIEAIEREIFEFSLKLSTDEVKGSLTERQRMAYRLFEGGDYEGASAVLDEIEIENDYRARKAKIIAKREAELKQSAIIYISEIKTKIDILALCKRESRDDEIYNLYSKIIPEIDEMEVCLEVVYDYSKFLMSYGYDNDSKHHKEALNQQLKLYDMYESNQSERTDEKMAGLDLLTGKNYLWLGETEDAIFYLQDAERTYSRLAALEPTRYNDCLVDVFNSLGRAYENKKSYIEAEKYYLMPVRFYTENGKIKSPKFRRVVADNYMLLNKEEYLRRALELYGELTGEGEGPYIDEQIECAVKIGGIILASTSFYNEEIVEKATSAFDIAINISLNNKGIDKVKYLERISELCQKIIFDYRDSLYFLATEYLQRVAELGISTLRELISAGDKSKIIDYYDSLDELYDKATSPFAFAFTGDEEDDSIIFKGEKREKYKQEQINLKIDKHLFYLENCDTCQEKVSSVSKLIKGLSNLIDSTNEEQIFNQLEKIISRLSKETEQGDSEKYDTLCAYLNAYYLFDRFNLERALYYFELAKELYLKNEDNQALSTLTADISDATTEILNKLLDAKNAKKADECLLFAIDVAKKHNVSSWQLNGLCDRLIALCHEKALADMEERWLKTRIDSDVLDKSKYDVFELIAFYADNHRYSECEALATSLYKENCDFAVAMALYRCYLATNRHKEAEEILLSYINESRGLIFNDGCSSSLLSGIRDASYALYNFYISRSMEDMANEILTREISIIKDLAPDSYKNQFLRVAYLALGNKWCNDGAYENAVSNYLLCMECLDNDKEGLGEKEIEKYETEKAESYVDVYFNLARAYGHLGNVDKQDSYIEKCADLCWCADKTEYLIDKMNEILSYLESNTSNNQRCYALMLIMKADTFLDYDFMTSERGNVYETAREYVDRAYNLVLSLEDKMSVDFVVYDVLLDYYEQNDGEKYNTVLLLAIEYAKALTAESFKEHSKKLKELLEKAEREDEYWRFIKGIEPLTAQIINEGIEIAGIKINWNKTIEAITMYEEMIDLVLNKTIAKISKRALGLLYLKLGGAYLKNEQLAEAEAYLLKAKAHFDNIMPTLSNEEKDNAMLNVASISYSLAQLYVQRQENQRAYECVKRYVEISELLEDDQDYFSYLHEKYQWAIELCLRCNKEAIFSLCKRYVELISVKKYDISKYIFCINALIKAESMAYAEELLDAVYAKENERLEQSGRGYVNFYKENVEKAIALYEKCGSITKSRRCKREIADLKL